MGRIVILNGAPRAGKTSIARALQARGPWIAHGVDAVMATLPEALKPGIGLRPGGERPDLEPAAGALYDVLYDTLASLARASFDVVADVGHHEGHSRPLGILPACARRLAGLPALFVGVRCGLDAVMERRRRSGGAYVAAAPGEPVPAPVLAWQEVVHRPGVYDLEVDTGVLSPRACADAILATLDRGWPRPGAMERLAGP